MDVSHATTEPPGALEQLCTYKFRVCNRACVPSFPYCDAHILEDRSMPFVQCQFHSKNGEKRCFNPVYKPTGQRLCDEHGLFHSGQEEEGMGNVESPTSSLSGCSSTPTSAGRRLNRPSHSTSSLPRIPGATVLSEWEREGGPLMEENWSSDANSVDSEDEDPLKRAGVYTKSELINQAVSRWTKYTEVCRQELVELKRRMQLSYSDYIRNSRRQHNSGTSSICHQSSVPITAQSQPSKPIQGSGVTRRSHKELKALRRFNLRPGKEYSLQKFGLMYKFGPLESSGKTNCSSKATRTCQYKDNRSTTSRKCPSRSLPCSSYCLEHIVKVGVGQGESGTADKTLTGTTTHSGGPPVSQVLLRQCGWEGRCSNPVVNWTPSTRCQFHTTLASLVTHELPTSYSHLISMETDHNTTEPMESSEKDPLRLKSSQVVKEEQIPSEAKSHLPSVLSPHLPGPTATAAMTTTFDLPVVKVEVCDDDEPAREAAVSMDTDAMQTSLPSKAASGLGSPIVTDVITLATSSPVVTEVITLATSSPIHDATSPDTSFTGSGGPSISGIDPALL